MPVLSEIVPLGTFFSLRDLGVEIVQLSALSHCRDGGTDARFASSIVLARKNDEKESPFVPAAGQKAIESEFVRTTDSNGERAEVTAAQSLPVPHFIARSESETLASKLKV